LLAYLLLRFAAFVSRWGHSFTRLFALIRTALWHKLDWRSLLEVYGTATGGGRFLGTPDQAYLPGFGCSHGTARARFHSLGGEFLKTSRSTNLQNPRKTTLQRPIPASCGTAVSPRGHIQLQG